MRRYLFRATAVRLLGIGAAALMAASAFAQPRADRGKYIVEFPVKNVIRGVAAQALLSAPAAPPVAPPPPVAPTKRAIEVPVKDAIKGVVAVPQPPAPPAPPPAPPDPRLDITKRKAVEAPVSAVVKGTAPATPPAARTDPIKQEEVERPVTDLVRSTPDIPTAVAKPNADENPVVKPGQVNWHATFQQACDAARKSGKPVLLFHMMGQLDRQFC